MTYYCHSCEQNVHASIGEDEEPLCEFCGGSFVELLEDSQPPQDGKIDILPSDLTSSSADIDPTRSFNTVGRTSFAHEATREEMKADANPRNQVGPNGDGDGNTSNSGKNDSASETNSGSGEHARGYRDSNDDGDGHGEESDVFEDFEQNEDYEDNEDYENNEDDEYNGNDQGVDDDGNNSHNDEDDTDNDDSDNDNDNAGPGFRTITIMLDRDGNEVRFDSGVGGRGGQSNRNRGRSILGAFGRSEEAKRDGRVDLGPMANIFEGITRALSGPNNNIWGQSFMPRGPFMNDYFTGNIDHIIEALQSYDQAHGLNRQGSLPAASAVIESLLREPVTKEWLEKRSPTQRDCAVCQDTFIPYDTNTESNSNTVNPNPNPHPSDNNTDKTTNDSGSTEQGYGQSGGITTDNQIKDDAQSSDNSRNNLENNDQGQSDQNETMERERKDTTETTATMTDEKTPPGHDGETKKQLAIELPCNHTFHDYCLLPWLTRHSTCPVCRSPLPTEEELAS